MTSAPGRPQRPRSRSRHLVAGAAGIFSALIGLPALAAGTLGPTGTPITTSDFGLDIFVGPVLGGSRTTGLGGAFTAIAEGNDGNLVNAATPAVRPFYSIDYFDYWIGFGLTLPALSELDFFNTGERREESRLPQSFLFLSPSLNLQFGTFGVGATVELQRYSLNSSATTSGSLVTTIATTHVQLANNFLDGQLVAGIGARLVRLGISDAACDSNGVVACGIEGLGSSGSAFSSSGAGLELGALIRPNDMQFRIGASLRTGISTTPAYSDELLPNSEGDLVISGPSGTFYLPRHVNLPWDVNLGVAYQLGRAFNAPWRTSDGLAEKELLKLRIEAIEIEEQRQEALKSARSDSDRFAINERYDRMLYTNQLLRRRALDQGARKLKTEFANWRHFYLLLSASLLVSDKVPSSVGIESYFDQVVVRSGEAITYSPHFGIEAESIPDTLKLRVGSYIEPGRSDGASPRTHATFGGDIRLGNFDVFGVWPDDYIWALGAFTDFAARYATFGVSLIGWYPRQRRGETPR